jgi:hypothetical protein
MRLIRDSLVALTIAGLVGGAYYRSTTERARRDSEDAARENVSRIQRQVMLQYALSVKEEGEDEQPTWHDYPNTIDPEWFGAEVPRNTLLPLWHPWLEIATREEYELSHPRDLIAADRETATFWYNPKSGIVRARVPAAASDAAALQLYNYITTASLRDLFVPEFDGQSRIAGATP